MNLAERYERRFVTALGVSIMVHVAAMMLSLPAPRVSLLDAQVPLNVHLVQEPAALVSELPRPPRPAPTRHARPRPAPLKHDEASRTLAVAPEPLPPVETIQAASQTEEVPARAAEPVDLPAVAAPLPPASEPVALLAPAPRAPSAELIALYTKSLSEMFARYKEYPRIAALRGWEGSVTMRLRVAPSGHLVGAEVLKSSGYDALDQQAIAMVSKPGVLPVPPAGLDSADFAVLVPIDFRLER